MESELENLKSQIEYLKFLVAQKTDVISYTIERCVDHDLKRLEIIKEIQNCFSDPNREAILKRLRKVIGSE